MKTRLFGAMALLALSFQTPAADLALSPTLTKTPTPTISSKSDTSLAKMTLNGATKSTLLSNGNRYEVSGNLSGFLQASDRDIEAGMIQVGAINLLFKDVPESAILTEKSDASAGLGFTTNGKQRLKFDAASGVIQGTLEGRLDTSHLLRYAKPVSDAKRLDNYPIPAQPAKLRVRIQLDKPIDADTGSGGIESMLAKMSMQLVAEDLPKFDMVAYQVDIVSLDVTLDITRLIWFEVAQNLCLQPVRIGKLQWINSFPPMLSVEYTGDGLAFGLPGAQTQWGKADLTFTVRDWKTVWTSSYWDLSDSEEAGLLATVNDADCVEVFFTDSFIPSSNHGGGFTSGSGSSSAKVVSSDENADHGIDLTHLAHEIGHVVSLMHPGSGFPTATWPNLFDGNSGTLLCPSGFMNDNPAVNSRGNEDNLSNPLLTFSLKLVSPGPDCTNNADCGPCT